MKNPSRKGDLVKRLKKSLLTILAFSLLQGAPKAAAHGGVEMIIFLPVIIAFQLLDLAGLNARTRIKGFWAISSRDFSENNLDLIHKKSNTIFSFNKATSLKDAKDACARVMQYDNPARLATPEEVLRLYTLRGIDRVGMFITTEENKGHIAGFYDGEKNYFSMKVKGKKLTLIDRPDSEKESPVICVRPFDKEPKNFGE